MQTITSLPDHARIWIYQANKEIPAGYRPRIGEAIDRFANEWVSHNRELVAAGELVDGRFIVLAVDDSRVGPSGCSIDSSVRFIQSLGDTLDVDFFDRLNFAYERDGAISTAHKDDFKELYAAGAIDDKTTVYDNLVKTVGDFRMRWKIPLGNSWMKRFV